jgi:hypothetical protein
MSGNIGVDLGEIDPDRPIGTFESNATQGFVKTLIESAPDKTWTFRDLTRRFAGNFLVGTPEQVADELASWAGIGVDGFNLVYTVTPGTFVDFVDGVVPVLQERGLMQREYGAGTLRQRVLGDGDRLPDRHPGAAYRRQPATVTG